MLGRRSRSMVVGGCLLVLASLLVSCSSSPSASSSSPSPSDSTAAKVTAQSLYGAFRSDKKSANGLYKGKRLEVNGLISHVGTDPLLNAPEVILAAGASTQGRGVDCIFEKQYAQQVSKLKPGQTITVQGTCVGFAVNVLMLHCSLTPSGS